MLLTYDDNANTIYLRSDHQGQVRKTIKCYDSHGVRLIMDLDLNGKPLGVQLILNGRWVKKESR